MAAVKKVRTSKYAGIVKGAAEESTGDKLLWILKAVAEKRLTPEEAVLVIGQGNTVVPPPNVPVQSTAQPQAQPVQNPQQGQAQAQR